MFQSFTRSSLNKTTLARNYFSTVLTSKKGGNRNLFSVFSIAGKNAAKNPPSVQQFYHSTSFVTDTASDENSLLAVHVFVSTKPGTEEAFLKASLANAQASAKEEGIARFDVIQEKEDPTKFVLVEVYKNEDAPAAHKQTEHYMTWRDTVQDMMAEPRSAIKYKTVFPFTSSGWDYCKSI